MNPNYSRCFNQAIASGMMFVLVLVHSPPADAGWVRRDWSKVEIITPGIETNVRLYKGHAPKGKRTIKGRFHSATAESVTLLLPDGQTGTYQKEVVEKVLVYRPVSKRYQGWLTLGIFGGIWAGAAATAEPGSGDDPPVWFAAAVVSAFVAGPTVIAFLIAPKMGGVYNVPGR